MVVLITVWTGILALGGWAVAVLVRRDRRRARAGVAPGDRAAGRRALRQARADARVYGDLGSGAAGNGRRRRG